MHLGHKMSRSTKIRAAVLLLVGAVAIGSVGAVAGGQVSVGEPDQREIAKYPRYP